MTMKIVAGSYERFLFGYKFRAAALLEETGLSNGKGQPQHDLKDQKGGRAFTSSFSYGAHLGPIKCVAASGNVAASGGSDEVIHVYDLQSRSELGSLIRHEGAVTSLQFHGAFGAPTHLLSGGDDGNIGIWDTDSWKNLAWLRGHKAPVIDLAIHSSGRLALSVSRDSQLRMWNLLSARCSFRTHLPAAPEAIMFAPEGNDYAIALQDKVVVMNAESGREVHSLQDERQHQQQSIGTRFLSVSFLSNNVVIAGGEGRSIAGWDVRSGRRTFHLPQSHANRIRGISALPYAIAPSELGLGFVSASSDGFIKLWDSRRVGEGTEKALLASVDTKARLTCLAVGGIVPSGGSKANANLGSTRGVESETGKREEEEEKKVEEEENEAAAERHKSIRGNGVAEKAVEGTRTQSSPSARKRAKIDEEKRTKLEARGEKAGVDAMPG
eukprot:TRINITY_DN7925_c0_g1_i1.p1 TRINITY_DN7925_c0_g1~~TRINITY_DN7925_c0_g1_i1.p1  ORF type:complete len:440 (-),score=91.93 TRINITY_DN7925_c0_g1_i1:185-1504(-)